MPETSSGERDGGRVNNTRPAPFRDACERETHAFPVAHSYLIGVSGGRDSVALLHGLVAAGYHSLIACHLDHQLRPESAEEAQFVRQLAEQLGLDAVCAREDVEARARESGHSLEASARTARYAFFARTAQQRNCPRLFLAHHADDQVETFLFNLMRGAGSGGLGMHHESFREIEGTPLQIVRPLLGVWRQDIDAYVAQHALAYREDASNLDPQFTRNRLRQQLLPQLEAAFGRDIRKSLWRTAEILRAEDEWLTTLIGTPPEELSVPLLRELPEAQQRRVIFTWLRNHGVPGLNFELVERVRALLHTRPAKTNLPGGSYVRRRAKRLFVERPGGEVSGLKI